MSPEEAFFTQTKMEARFREQSAGNTLCEPEPELAQAISEIHQLRHTIQEAKSALSDFIDRVLTGPQPPMAEASGMGQVRRAFNGGVTGQLRGAIADAQESAQDAMRLAHSLRQIG